MATVLAIDQGTSGTKAVVVTDDGAVTGMGECALRPDYLPGGGVEIDAQDLLDSVVESGRRAMSAAGGRVDMITLANQGESVLAWDRATGRPLSRMIIWQDRRAQEICDELKVHADLIAERTGLVLDPYFSAPKQAWLRRHATTDGVATTSDTWLIHQLTGEFVTDASTASRSLTVDSATTTWDSELLGLFGLGGEQLPRIVDSDDIVGTTTAFGAETPLGGLIVDQQAALIAQRCFDRGAAKTTFGTGAFLLANAGPTPRASTAGLSTSVAWRLREGTAFALDGQVYAAASAVRWLQRLGLITDASDLDAVAAQDSGGVLAVPALAGLAAPWWRADAKASLQGVTLATGPGEIVRAVLEGIASQVVDLVRAVEADLDVPLEQLRVDGGLTRSQVLMQAVADQLQREVQVYPSAHATALGSAALGRLAADRSLDLDRATPAWEPSAVHHPRWRPDRATEHLEHWRAALEATLPRT